MTRPGPRRFVSTADSFFGKFRHRLRCALSPQSFLADGGDVDLGEFSFDFFNFSTLNPEDQAAVSAYRFTGKLGGEAFGTDADRAPVLRFIFPASPIAAFDCPDSLVVRQSVALTVPGVVEDDGFGFSGAWPKNAAHLLEVKAQGLRRPKKDRNLNSREVKPLTKKLDV